jgi:anti-sigma factor ChrR (cupin superfamily)
MAESGGTPPIEALSAFVRDWLAEHDESVRGLSRRARDPVSGFVVNHGYIAQLIHGTVKAPELWRLRALGVGMGVPAQRLAELAALQWLGVEVAHVSVGEDDDRNVLFTVHRPLTPEERAKMIKLAEDMARTIFS